jgi:hypothetical protein
METKKNLRTGEALHRREQRSLDDPLASGSTLTFTRLGGFSEEPVLVFLLNCPRTAAFLFRWFGALVDIDDDLLESPRQRRLAITSATACLHPSFVAENFPHHAKESMMRRNPLRPGLCRASQSILEEGARRLSSGPVGMRAAGWSDLHHAHHSVENRARLLSRNG